MYDRKRNIKHIAALVLLGISHRHKTLKNAF